MQVDMSPVVFPSSDKENRVIIENKAPPPRPLKKVRFVIPTERKDIPIESISPPQPLKRMDTIRDMVVERTQEGTEVIFFL